MPVYDVRSLLQNKARLSVFAFLLIALYMLLSSCQSRKLRGYDFPTVIETADQPIQYQEAKKWTNPDGKLSIDNQFASARISDLEWEGNRRAKISIQPENKPINPSPWYAFRVVGEAGDTVLVDVDYGDAYHRYFPKLSGDGQTWTPIDSSYFRLGSDTTSAQLRLRLDKDTLWVAGQELWPSHQVEEWVDKLANTNTAVKKTVVGKSKLGRDIIALELVDGTRQKKPAIVLLSRQHPPEVTGFLAFKSFVEELLANDLSQEFLARYRILIYPLVNPDGVDLGHWRHNAGGIDLNRDWAHYRQPEVAIVAQDIVNKLHAAKNELQLGIDFHSTWRDVYYTPDPSIKLNRNQDFRPQWHKRIETLVGGGFKVNNDPTPIGRPTSAGWFVVHFGVPGITYEVGDSTPRDFIDQKARASAQAMMEVLLNN